MCDRRSLGLVRNYNRALIVEDSFIHHGAAIPSRSAVSFRILYNTIDRICIDLLRSILR
jgi:hypothetical protein